MTLTLSSAEQARLAATARALLSPLDAVSTDGWRGDVLGHLAELLEADGGGFILPARDEPPYTLHDLPEAFAREFLERGDDHAAMEAVRRQGGGVWNTRQVGQWLGLRMPEDWFASEDYRSFYHRYGIRDGIGFMAFADPYAAAGGSIASDRGPTAAVLTCFREVFGTEMFGDRGLAILRLLLPALDAGVAARVRLAGQRRALEKAFDAARYGLAVYDVHGRRLYTNEALPELLRRDPQPERLIGALQMGLRSVASLTERADDAPAQALSNASRELRTADARYRLRLNLIGEGLFASGPAILATLERLTPEPPTRRGLRERWGLTPQEARVALLLARGGTNRQIAEAMDLSPATIRHYTEALFHKLDVHSRAEATARILTG